ncbi:MAG: hypothetical protein K2X27_24345 [Candidatus Obscuribacterales bacterium]|nr:hypothetical protein [Candidatus Obscuribacterales bacterium]
MLRSSSIHHVPELPEQDFPALLPKQPYLAAVRDISDRVGGVEALFDQNGRVRTLTAISDDGLWPEVLSGEAEDFAQNFIDSEDIVKALGLRNVELECTNVVDLPNLGKRVEFRQLLTVDGTQHPVRGGYLHVFIDTAGHIFQVNSTIRFGRRPASIAKIISPEDAIEIARASIGVSQCENERAELVISSHNERMDPCYEVTLSTAAPRKVVLVIVKATSGQVVHKKNKLCTAVKSIRLEPRKARSRKRQPRAQTQTFTAPGKSFLRIPDPKLKLQDQIFDAVLDMLPDPKVLKNDNCIIYLGGSKKEVRAKADGSFKYDESAPEFAAVTTFFAFNAQMELYKSWGMVAPEKPIPIYVHDPSVSDNAYFDPEGYEIHIGVGSGVPFGLTKNIAYDLGVTWHENGHHVVYLQTPGKDLPGPEGGAIHESMGDVLGDLLMDFWFRLKYGKELGSTLTAQDVDADTRIIGKFAMPPNGIRIQKNTAKTPDDKTGEPHDDGLISGGAKADLLVAMCTQKGVELEQALVDFGKLSLSALALVPAHKVGFQDLLKAYITADSKLFNGAHKKLIVKAFGDHGIKLKGASSRSAVVVNQLG